MDPSSHPRFDRLAPISAGYATLPIVEAFNWEAAVTVDDEGEWYLVAFRSILRETADRELLREYDERAHLEAEASPGFVYYFKGPANAHRECLSFCVWDTRRAAREAAGGPAHREAIGIVHDTYERYTLEFHRLTKRRGSATIEFEAYDRIDPGRAA